MNRYVARVKREVVIRRLRRHQGALQALGLRELSLFGSTARGEAAASSDVDLATVLDDKAQIDLFRFAAISERLTEMLGTGVDLVAEPARNARMQAEIDRDRVRVF